MLIYCADLAVGLGTRQIKTGAPCRSERLAKYNQVHCLLAACAVFVSRSYVCLLDLSCSYCASRKSWVAPHHIPAPLSDTKLMAREGTKVLGS